MPLNRMPEDEEPHIADGYDHRRVIRGITYRDGLPEAPCTATRRLWCVMSAPDGPLPQRRANVVRPPDGIVLAGEYGPNTAGL